MGKGGILDCFNSNQLLVQCYLAVSLPFRKEVEIDEKDNEHGPRLTADPAAEEHATLLGQSQHRNAA